jgi:hypothetical protein
MAWWGLGGGVVVTVGDGVVILTPSPPSLAWLSRQRVNRLLTAPAPELAARHLPLPVLTASHLLTLWPPPCRRTQPRTLPS